MKKHNIPVVSLVLLLSILAGCQTDVPATSLSSERPGASSAGEPSSDPGSAYSFDETEFLTLYNRALEQRKTGKKPSSPAPQDPSETGFGVLPLDRETYGTSAYAFLPLQERELNEEEMLQLAWGMEGLSGEELLKPEHARTGILSEEAGYEALLQNRAFHEEERRRLLLLEPAYLYDGRRASADPDGAPLLVRLQEDKEFAILPLENLSEEGLLHSLDVKYAGVSLAEDLLPTEEELSYQDLPAVLREANAKYHFYDGKLPRYSAMLTQNDFTAEKRNPMRETWNVIFLNETGDQFAAGFRAAGGELSGWVRYPPGYFTDPDFAFPELPGEGTEISGEERKKRAADYALSILEEAEVASAEQEGGYQDPLYGAADWFAVRMKDGGKVTLAVQKSSGLILNVSILPQNP